MLKEERKLRDKLKYSYGKGESIFVEKYVSREITAMRRAIIEDCAKVADDHKCFTREQHTGSRTCGNIISGIIRRKK